MSRRLRFGVMGFGTNFAAWETECLRRVLAVPDVELSLLIVDNRPPPSQTPSSFGTRVRKFLSADKRLWLLYERLFVTRYVTALKRVEIPKLFVGIPRIDCVVDRKGKFSEYFKADDIREIRKYDLDFILRFAFGIIRGEILNTPRYGVWSFHHDDEEHYRGSPSRFWEIYHNDPKTGVILQRLTDRLDGGIILKRGYMDTVNDSYARNLNAGLFGALHWPAEICHDILNGNSDYFNNPPSKSTAPLIATPTDAEMLTFTVRIIKNWVVNRLSGKSHQTDLSIGTIGSQQP